MKRAVILLSLLTLSASAQTATSAFGLQITPKGSQKLNLATGVTEMPQGGTVRDAKTGIVVVASSLSVKAGDTLTAQGATLSTRQGGTLKADKLVYNEKVALITATGDLNYSDKQLKNLTAQTLYIDTRTGAVTAVGAVSTTSPVTSAAQMVALPTKSQLLLSGNAKASGNGKQISGEKVLINLSSGQAQTNLSSGALTAFAPYLK